jgi:hypothetical protein
VWARDIPDRSGNVKPQARPLLVVQPGPIDRNSPLCCLAISTDPKLDPGDPAIEMPWDADDGGTTGLRAWCRVVLLWFVLVDQVLVEEISGSVDPLFLARVMDERDRALTIRRAK